jgi:hypothetical protein
MFQTTLPFAVLVVPHSRWHRGLEYHLTKLPSERLAESSPRAEIPSLAARRLHTDIPLLISRLKAPFTVGERFSKSWRHVSQHALLRSRSIPHGTDRSYSFVRQSEMSDALAEDLSAQQRFHTSHIIPIMKKSLQPTRNPLRAITSRLSGRDQEVFIEESKPSFTTLLRVSGPHGPWISVGILACFQDGDTGGTVKSVQDTSTTALESLIYDETALLLPVCLAG